MTARPAPAEAARLKRSAAVFAALGDSTRLALVAQLCDAGPRSIAQLTACSGVTRQAVTKHLRTLADAGLVVDTADPAGRQRRWALQPQRLSEVRAALDTVARQWDDALARLQAFVEAGPS